MINTGADAWPRKRKNAKQPTTASKVKSSGAGPSLLSSRGHTKKRTVLKVARK